MIEVIYKEENREEQEETAVQIPRNIRQIGQSDENSKIYIEDYVYTFLVRLARSAEEKDGQKARVAVLTGESRWYAGTSWLFIRGALIVENMEAAADHIDFTDEIWQKVHEEQEKYFAEQEVAGWFFSQPQIPVESSEIFTRVHLKHFGGEKVLMIMEPQEREDAFFRYENGVMEKQGGYYIFYEKNPQMQAYMIEKNSELQTGEAEKCEDKAVKNFRRIITDKKQDAQERASVFSYAATACLAAAVLLVGVNFYRNYQSMKSIETEIRQASSVIVEEVTPVPTQEIKSSEGAVLKKNTIPTQLPKKKDITPTQSPSVTKSPEREKIQKEEDSAASGDEIYREESDVRKAQRRKALEEKKNETEVSSGGIHESYVIKPGDTLFQISMARYGNMDAMAEICRLNGLSLEEIIYPGQVIVLP
ncbi:MAG: LysM peptidoglycan-binding domain-containing protein [Eubacteriales bacterium]|nr:LysM peptidoglycan-binding domain-containing protein [Eubacteriales bacterium]